MFTKSKSIRAFIGAKDFQISRQFYKELGFIEYPIDEKMVWFKVHEGLSFYLQNYYIKDWIDNSMVFLEVEDLDSFEQNLLAKELSNKYNGVKITKINDYPWGREIFMHDPSGVLWHFGEFK